MTSSSNDISTSELATPHGVTLERFAFISAEVAEGDRSLLEVLERHQLSESQWNEVSQHWLLKIAEDAQANGAQCRLPLVYSEAFGKAQDSLKAVPTMAPEDWALLSVEIERTGGTDLPLARRQMSQADYLRLARYFAAELARNGQANARFRATYEHLQNTRPDLSS
jgi:hypothetical protein